MQELKYLQDVLIILASSILIVVLFRRLRMSPVLGYLIVGTIIGEHGYDIIAEPGYAHNLGELGIIFLLFVIGLELTFARLMKMRWHVFGFGGSQLILSSIPLAFLLSYYFEFRLSIAIVFGATLALSSTAIVLQVLAESKRQSTQVGRLALSVLLMQDLAVVPLLAILPLLANTQNDILYILGYSALKALIAFAGITAIGRILLRPLFSVIGSAKSDEVYVPTTLLLVLSSAVATNNLGLSTAMGAFIAGLLIAETEYRNRVENSIMPFKSLLLGLFFMSVGMSIDVGFILRNLGQLLVAAAILLAVKCILICILCKIFRFQWGASIHSGLLLSQGGEFGFVLIGLALQKKIISNYDGQLLLMIIAITMAFTPLLCIIGSYLEDKMDYDQKLDSGMEFKGVSDLDSHVIIAGFGRAGRVVAYMLTNQKIDYVAVDSNAALVKKACNQGFPIYHGDLSDIEILQAVGAERASAVVLTMSDVLSIHKAVKNIANHYKQLSLVARTEDYKHGIRLRKVGASVTVPATIETGLQLGGTALRYIGVPDHEIIDLKERIRQNDYATAEEIEGLRGVYKKGDKSKKDCGDNDNVEAGDKN